MDRKQRRDMEKKLGVSKFKKTLTRSQKWDLIRENQIQGKLKMNEMKETIRRQLSHDQDQIDSNRIASLTTELIVKEQLSYSDANTKAKELYKQELEKTSKNE